MTQLEKNILKVNAAATENKMKMAIAVLKDALDYVESVAVYECKDKNLYQVNLIKEIIETMSDDMWILIVIALLGIISAILLIAHILIAIIKRL